MQGYDLLMLGVMAIAIFRGYSKGLAWQISSIASIVVSYIVAYRFKDRVAQMIEMPDPWRGLVAMMALFIGSSLVIWLIFQSIRGGIEKAKLKDFDKQLGAIFGGVKGAVWCTLLTVLALSFLGQGTSQQIVDSHSGGYIARLLASSKTIMPSEFRQVVQPYLVRAESKLQGRTDPDPSTPFEIGDFSSGNDFPASTDFPPLPQGDTNYWQTDQNDRDPLIDFSTSGR